MSKSVGKRHKRLDQTYSGDLLDKMVSLVNRYARREITRLRACKERDAEEGRALFHRYSTLGGGPGIPHEIEDFLQSL